jgi:two-component system sensor histidine kinase ComP
MNRKIFIKIFFGAFIAMQVWFVYVMFSYPVFGIYLDKTPDQKWVISNFDPRNIAAELGLQLGDEIVEVNGEATAKYFSIIKWRTIDQANTIVVSRAGTKFEVSTKDLPHSSGDDVLSLCGEIVSFVIAFLLYRKLSHSPSAQYLSYVFISIGTIFMSLAASVRGDTLGKILIGNLVMLLPIIFLHFLFVFLKEKGNIHLSSKFLKYLYVIVHAVTLVRLIYLTPMAATYYVNNNVMALIMLFFIFGIALNLIYLSSLYLLHRKEKTYFSFIIKTIWVSLLISFYPLICFTFIPQILIGYPWVDPLYTGCFVLFFPLSFAYLIATKRLYDIDAVIRRILFTMIISFIPSLLVTITVRELFPHDSTAERLIIVFILLVAIMSTLLYSLEYFTIKLEPIMFPKKNQLQAALKKIAKNLGSVTSFREFKEIILVDLVSTLQVYGGAIAFKYKESVEIIGHGDIELAAVEQMVSSGHWNYEEFSCFEINRHEEYTSYLIMTQKKTRTLLGLEERQWLNLIITYLTVSLENVHVIRKLTMKLQQLASQIPDEQAASEFNWFRKLMFELQEKERVRIATDLHDTTMQDLFFLKERLHAVLEKYAFSKEDVAQMVSIIEYIDVINSNLRQSCFELHPYLLKEIGLVPTIERLVDFEMAVSPFGIEFTSSQVSIIELWELDTKKHIFRMVQELINNAKKHSYASVIKIKLGTVSQSIQLDYEDDGVGFEPDSVIANEIGSSGVGIEQMKTRVLSLNGRYELVANKGEGMKFKATFPLKEDKTA